MLECPHCYQQLNFENFSHIKECEREQFEQSRKQFERKYGKKIVDVLRPPKTMNSQTMILPARITKNVYLGCSDAATNEQWLKENRITHVLNVANECSVQQDLYNRLGIIWLHLKMNDSVKSSKNGLEENMYEAVEFISAANSVKGRILVHCSEGISRSATILAIYLMKCKKMSLLKALTLLRKKRAIIYPNKGFFKQLVQIEAKLFKKNSISLEAVNDLHQDKLS